MPAEVAGESYSVRQWAGWVLGPGMLLLTLLVPPPDGLSVQGWRTVGAGSLMAIFWMAESIPIPVTALLPLVLFPFLGLGDIRETAAPFANPIIYLFYGGFIIAIAMQRWGLHRPVAIGHETEGRRAERDEADLVGVEDGDHRDGTEVVDDRQREQEDLEAGRDARAEDRERGDAKAMSVAIGMPQPAAASPPGWSSQ